MVSGYHAYFKSWRNCIDFFLLVLDWANLFGVFGARGFGIPAARSVRALPALRWIRYNPDVFIVLET
ncbi:MAG: hypothetical protein ACPG7T_09720, partial [Ilumatobacteraceae bacterium]